MVRRGEGMVLIESNRGEYVCFKKSAQMELEPLASFLIGTLCEDRVLDGPASGVKGSKGEPYVL